MTGRLAGKVALVTGAGSVGPGWGNGRAAAVLFAREGARVVAVDRDRAAAVETARLIGEELGEALVLEADVTQLASVTAMADAALRRFGRIDVLLNNVGGSITGGPVEMSVEDFRGQIDLNLTSVFITAKVLLPTMVGVSPPLPISASGHRSRTSLGPITWNGTPMVFAVPQYF